MAKVVFIFGKSSTGKDTIAKELLRNDSLELNTIITYTTRPMREGEMEGKEYHFVTDEDALNFEKDGSVVETREYHTVKGLWKYFTRNDGQIDLSSNNKYLVLGTLEMYEKYCAYFGKELIAPIYIDIDNGIRLQRALDREKTQPIPQYKEMCRRFIADEEDFSEDKLAKNGITRRFINDDLKRCIAEIEEYILNL